MESPDGLRQAHEHSRFLGRGRPIVAYPGLGLCKSFAGYILPKRNSPDTTYSALCSLYSWLRGLDGRAQVSTPCCPIMSPIQSRLCMRDLQPFFRMPISNAARELNVGVTVLKKTCRSLGVSRWPYRKLHSMRKLIDSVHNTTAQV